MPALLETHARRPRRWPYALAVLLTVLLVLALAGVSILQGRHSREAKARQEVSNTARLLQAHLRDNLDKVDLMLLSLVDQAERLRRSGLPQAQWSQHLTLAPLRLMDGLWFGAADHDGQVFFRLERPSSIGSAGPPLPYSLDPALVRWLQQPVRGGLMVIGPVQAPVTQTWQMVLARSIKLSDGSTGAVYAELPTEQIGLLLGSIDLGPQAAMTVRTSDLALVFRQPWTQQAAVGKREVSAQLREVVLQHPQEGEFDAVTAIDGIRRTNAYRRVGSYPFYVLVGMPLDDLSEGWNLQESLALLLALLAISLGSLLFRHLYRDARRQVDAVHQRYEAIIESSRDAIISKDTSGIITSWNAAAQQIFGYSAAEMIGQSVQRLVPPERLAEEQDLLVRIRRNERIEHYDTVRMRKDGTLINVAVSISPILDADGLVIGASKIARDISRQKAEEEQIRQLAYRDALTGLPNRRLLLDRLQHAQQMGQRTQSFGALLFMDLDRFKQVNDQLGHEAGDTLLVQVAARLQELVRESDTVARHGGDEFVVLCENLGPSRPEAEQAAMALAQKIEAALEHPFMLGHTEARSGASVGWQLFLGDTIPLGDLLHAADAAMYRRKTARRNEHGITESAWGTLR